MAMSIVMSMAMTMSIVIANIGQIADCSDEIKKNL
jgi:hypothetical protein